MIPSKKAELANWIRSQLGEPVMDTLQLETSQLENNIDDAIDYYQLFSGGVGNEMNYCIINAGVPPVSGSVCTISGTPFSFCDPTMTAPILVNRAEWQLPRSVIAVTEALPASNGGVGGQTWLTNAPGQDIIERGINAAEAMSETMWGSVVGGPINTSINNSTGLFFPGAYFGGGGGGPYGTQGGTRAAGAGPDLISYELGLEYMEMINQRYRISVHLEFHEATRRLRIQPPPRQQGAYVIGVWTRVAPEHLYDDYFIRHYALALAMMQVGRTMKKYKGGKFQGGLEFDADFFYNEGKEDKKQLEQDLQDNKYGYPPAAFRIG
jgi:hypothetical protein